MQVRYRYRVYPGPAQQQALARVFGCARVVYNDCLRMRDQCRKAAHPRPRRKHGRQSVRLTRNGFAPHGGRLYVAKAGDIGVEWSRPLPSVPSSVTVIREPDGRYCASFVVERAATPPPACDREVGIDLGLARLVVTSGGEVIANPRFWRARQRKLARAQRALSRKQKGSANRAKARRRVAVVHRKVRETRLDHSHCEGGVRPGPALAAAGEAGAHRSAA